MTTRTHSDDVDTRVVPAWELQDRLARAMRMVKGMSQSDVAEVMGVRRETVSRWLNGQNTPSRTTLLVWADMCGCDADWLITGEASNVVRLKGFEPLTFCSVVPRHLRSVPSVKPTLTVVGLAS